MTFPLINAASSIVRLPDPSPADAPAAVAIAEPEPALLAPRIFYTPEKYGALEEFLISPDFKIFEEQLQSGIHELIQFVRDQTPGEEAEKEQATLNLTEDLAYFSKNLLVEDSLDTEMREISEMSGLALHRKQEAYGE